MGVHEVQCRFQAVVALGEATVALRRARDLHELASGSTIAAASIDILHQAASALLTEAGQQLAALRDSPDPEVAAFVALLLRRLGHAPAVAPAPSTSEAPPSEKADAP